MRFQLPVRSRLIHSNRVEQAETANLGNLIQRGGDLLAARVAHTGGEPSEDAFLLIFARADDEGEAEALLILSVEPLERRDLASREVVQASRCLLCRRGWPQRAGARGAANEVGMR